MKRMTQHDNAGDIARYIGYKIRQVMKEKNISFNQIEGGCSVGGSSIINWGKGVSLPSLAALYTLCDFLDVSVYDLLPASALDADDLQSVIIQDEIDDLERQKQELLSRMKPSKKLEVRPYSNGDVKEKL